MIYSKNAIDIIGKMCYTYEYRITLILKRGKHMKRLITFLLASSLLLAAGCGSSSGSTVTAPPSGDTTTEAADPDLDATIEELEAKMKAAAARLDFEEAARLRDIIRERG